jgi:hypothetical protein
VLSEIHCILRSDDPGPNAEWADLLIDELRSCNHITVDEPQLAPQAVGFPAQKLELMSETVHPLGGLKRFVLSRLVISAVKLVASGLIR